MTALPALLASTPRSEGGSARQARQESVGNGPSFATIEAAVEPAGDKASKGRLAQPTDADKTIRVDSHRKFPLAADELFATKALEGDEGRFTDGAGSGGAANAAMLDGRTDAVVQGASAIAVVMSTASSAGRTAAVQSSEPGARRDSDLADMGSAVPSADAQATAEFAQTLETGVAAEKRSQKSTPGPGSTGGSQAGWSGPVGQFGAREHQVVAQHMGVSPAFESDLKAALPTQSRATRGGGESERPAGDLGAMVIKVVSKEKHLVPVQERMQRDASRPVGGAFSEALEDRIAPEIPIKEKRDFHGPIDLASAQTGYTPVVRLQPVVSAVGALAASMVSNTGAVDTDPSKAAPAQSMKSLTLQLSPVELGLVNVTLKLQGSVLVVALAAEQPQAVQALSQNATELANLLEATGYDIGDIEITAISQQPASVATSGGDSSNRADMDVRGQNATAGGTGRDESASSGTNRNGGHAGSGRDASHPDGHQSHQSGLTDYAGAPSSSAMLVV
jgi:hypothetical protein